ncbi:MAG: hypothetical protein AMJ54_08400 [Deltaproteobacteria bacterium SG8_13]|nr:MAG: hypothetical protein AMJ54_08400 [Deltaproteobacteria bacterium SG8_13]
MNKRGKELSGRLQEFSDELTTAARNLTAAQWAEMLPSEQWPVGVTMRHLAAGHLGITSLARMMVNGEKLPEITLEALKEMANRHAREHADCTKEEVLELLEKNSAEIVSFTAGLTDEQLDRTGYLVATGEVSVQQIIEYVVFMSAGEHFANIKTALDTADSS